MNPSSNPEDFDYIMANDNPSIFSGTNREYLDLSPEELVTDLESFVKTIKDHTFSLLVSRLGGQAVKDFSEVAKAIGEGQQHFEQSLRWVVDKNKANQLSKDYQDSWDRLRMVRDGNITVRDTMSNYQARSDRMFAYYENDFDPLDQESRDILRGLHATFSTTHEEIKKNVRIISEIATQIDNPEAAFSKQFSTFLINAAGNATLRAVKIGKIRSLVHQGDSLEQAQE